jgi:DNA-binding Lrp family transcriptional regulator
MDDMDRQLLIHMEQNSRLSLKKLAQKINVKTSTLYHRLHKLSELRIIERNSVIVNPERIGVDSFFLCILSPKVTSDNKPDRMFLTSFATFLSEQFKEIYFGAIGIDLKLYLFVSFFSVRHQNKFFKLIKDNPYIGEITKIKLNTITKGLRMFSFNDEVLLEELNLEQKKKEGKKSTLIADEKKITRINLKKSNKADNEDLGEDLGELVKLSD